MDFFSIPHYKPSSSILKFEVLKEADFSIDRLEISEVYWKIYDGEFNPSIWFSNDGYGVVKYMKVVAESLLITHFGNAIIDEVFQRYRKIIDDRISKEKT